MPYYFILNSLFSLSCNFCLRDYFSLEIMHYLFSDCSAWLGNSNTLTSTEALNSPSAAALSCQSCGKVYNHLSSLQRHRKNRCGQNGDFFQCPTCKNKYKRSDVLLRHLKYECGKEPRFKCPLCDFRSKRKENRDAHLLTHT